jgi:ubiquinone/menaquinone biosynthesis C-methylase UbiE
MSERTRRRPKSAEEGWHGWNEYAEFYDWENARTMGERDVPFWHEFSRRDAGPVLELGCGTGRVTAPLARKGLPLVGVDRAADMLARADRRLRRARLRDRVHLVRADIAALPFSGQTFSAVIAPYGILQSLLSDRLLAATLAGVNRVLASGGGFGLELVPDVPRWQETDRKVSLVGLRGPHGKPVTLIESVRQDRSRRITTFDHEFVEGTGASCRALRFTVRFRTLRVPAMVRRLQRAGFVVDATYGGYRGEPWSDRADTWIVVARKS